MKNENNWARCNNCGEEYGLHSPDDGHLFDGEIFKNDKNQANDMKDENGEMIEINLED